MASRRTISTSANINYRTLLLRTAQRDGRSSMFHQFAVGLERQVSTSFVASADVVGSLGRNITLLRNLNQPANGNGARPYPNFGAIQYRDHAGESRYRGLDLSLEKRFSQGPQLSRVVHDRRPARQHAGASVRCLAPAAEHQRSRRVGSAGRQRHPASLRRQLHRRPAARPAIRSCATGSSPAS